MRTPPLTRTSSPRSAAARLRSRAVSLLLALGALLLSCLALPAPASAIPGIPDCTTAPTPEVPGRGVVGFFEPSPKTAPEPGDPFAENTTTSIHEQYGYAGLRWNTYDLGCGPDMARSPDAPVGTSIANWVLTVPKAAIAATGALLSAAYQPDFLGVFDPLISKVVDGLRSSVFEQWIGLTVAALGFLLIWRSRQAALASSTSAIGWALLIMVIATVIFRWPLVAGHAADQTVTSVMSTVTGALNEDEDADGTSPGGQATANLHTSLLYQAWLGGQFGDANTAVATKYGPAIFDAQALTWREAEILRNDPGRGQQIIKDKQEKFEATASKIKAEDPDAYEYLVGRRSDARVGYAFLSLLGMLCAIPFLLVSALLILGALVIVRFGVMMFPVFATLAVFPAMRTLVIGLGNTLSAALINAVVFGLGTAVMVKGIGVIMSPQTGLPAWLVVALMLLLTLVMWYALKPFRRLTHMVGSRQNHFGEAAGAPGTAGRGLARSGGKLVMAAAGSFLGNSAAAKATTDDNDGPKTRGVPTRAEAHGVFGGPSPVAASAASASRLGAGATVLTPAQASAVAAAGGAAAGAVASGVRGGGSGTGTARGGDSVPPPPPPPPPVEADAPSRSIGSGRGSRETPSRVPAESVASAGGGAAHRELDHITNPSATYTPKSRGPEGQSWTPTTTHDEVPSPVEPSGIGSDNLYLIYRPDGGEGASRDG